MQSHSCTFVGGTSRNNKESRKSLPAICVKSSHASYNITAICLAANRSDQGSRLETIAIWISAMSRSRMSTKSPKLATRCQCGRPNALPWRAALWNVWMAPSKIGNRVRSVLFLRRRLRQTTQSRTILKAQRKPLGASIIVGRGFSIVTISIDTSAFAKWQLAPIDRLSLFA